MLASREKSSNRNVIDTESRPGYRVIDLFRVVLVGTALATTTRLGLGGKGREIGREREGRKRGIWFLQYRRPK